MATDHRAALARIKRFDQLIAYLRDNLDTALHLDAVVRELTERPAWPEDEASTSGATAGAPPLRSRGLMVESTTTETEADAGFWIRVWAAIIDSVLACLILVPILVSVYGWTYFDPGASSSGLLDFLLSWVFPAVAVVAFWILRSATPGKMLIGARIIDARTGAHPSTAQFIGRYFAYFLSTVPLGLGLIWVGIDSRKQGWHDKLAGTVVVRKVKT